MPRRKFKVPTKQTSIQLTESTQRQVEYLELRGFGGFTDIVRIAIDRMYRDEKRKEDKNAR